MKIALIGPGLMPIPPNNWGAIEILIWDYKECLNELGHEVDIINTTNIQEIASAVNNTNYDFIHLHYDEYLSGLSQLTVKPFCTTTHYGFVKDHYPNYNGWGQIFQSYKDSPGLISLSPEIEKIFKLSGYSNFSKVLRNGARTEKFNYKKNTNQKALCLGKIDYRKRQADISEMCGDYCNIDFIGPIADSRFKEHNKCKYAGIWNKQDLYDNLTNYNTLILLSSGEAAPLVVPEALSAGLSLVLSETAAGNLDKSLPFIHVIPNNILISDLNKIINESIENNYKYRDVIREYAKTHFDWKVIMGEYIKIIKEFNEHK